MESILNEDMKLRLSLLRGCEYDVKMARECYDFILAGAEADAAAPAPMLAKGKFVNIYVDLDKNEHFTGVGAYDSYEDAFNDRFMAHHEDDVKWACIAKVMVEDEK